MLGLRRYRAHDRGSLRAGTGHRHRSKTGRADTDDASCHGNRVSA